MRSIGIQNLFPENNYSNIPTLNSKNDVIGMPVVLSLMLGKSNTQELFLMGNLAFETRKQKYNSNISAANSYKGAVIHSQMSHRYRPRFHVW